MTTTTKMTIRMELRMYLFHVLCVICSTASLLFESFPSRWRWKHIHALYFKVRWNMRTNPGN